jgi:hypothetical protein
MEILRWLALAVALAQSAPAAPTNVRVCATADDPSCTPPPVSGLPAGVTLRAIDGGPTYYADRGFTYAAKAGWDSPSFFPIGMFLEKIKTQAHADAWRDLNLNTAVSAQAGDVTLSVMRSNGLYLIAQADELSAILSNNGGSLGSETVGINVFDEPTTYAQAIGAIQRVANVHQDNRLLYENYTHNQLSFFDVEGHRMDDLLNDLIATPNGTRRHLDLASVDIYWMAGNNGADGGAYSSATLYNRSTLSTDERRRGARYGDMIDWMRLGNPIHGHAPYQTTYPAPTSVFIETGGPYTENRSIGDYIQPRELNAAIWSVLIHGARYLQYFQHTFGSAGGDSIIAGTFFKSVFPGQSISIYNQLKASNALVKSLATVLNSPFALGYVTVTPAGWKFGDSPSSSFNGTGIDVMAKYHNVSGGNNKFYVFAMPRYSPNLTNQTATFTIKNTGSTQVTVINENRTLPVTNNGTQFQDTFANGHTVHIYRVE